MTTVPESRRPRLLRRGIYGALATAALAVAVAVPAAAPAVADPIQPDGTYRINTGESLTDTNTCDQGDGGTAVMRSFNKTATNQQWVVTHLPNGKYTIAENCPTGPTKYLTAGGPVNFDAGRVVGWTPENTPGTGFSILYGNGGHTSAQELEITYDAYLNSWNIIGSNGSTFTKSRIFTPVG